MARVQTNGKVFRLQGLSFAEELDGQVLDFESKLLYLALVPWEFCNWSCRYCHEERRFKESGELAIPEMKDIIAQASAASVRTLILLGGEVLLRSTWERTREIIQCAHEHDLITIVYTNGSQLDEAMALWLADRRVSIALKVDTLDPEKHEAMTKTRGSYDTTMRAIEIVKATSIGATVYETDKERLVRLLFTTVGSSWNVSEYVSLARFATNHGARWMMESLNHRGDAVENTDLAIDSKTHSEAMGIAMALNPEQHHAFETACRLFSCLTIRKRGEIASCPQDYNFLGNIRATGNFEAAAKLVLERMRRDKYRESWNGECPIKERSLSQAVSFTSHIQTEAFVCP